MKDDDAWPYALVIGILIVFIAFFAFISLGVWEDKQELGAAICKVNGYEQYVIYSDSVLVCNTDNLKNYDGIRIKGGE